MPDTNVTVYPYRRKLDGSFDFICLNCLATIGTAREETDASTKDHVCRPVPLSLAN
jgi:hypothetical protein